LKFVCFQGKKQSCSTMNIIGWTGNETVDSPISGLDFLTVPGQIELFTKVISWGSWHSLWCYSMCKIFGTDHHSKQLNSVASYISGPVKHNALVISSLAFT
jgi:hypothetical protein